ncbi:hypothetical protein TWF694_005076 [Orbilia ellipsospora]|uniref:Uncharacterized protein n=1 Tax=Orbilia ellipsospora TaxID=2528407 RepID=A0AAV9X0L8_9PEZI
MHKAIPKLYPRDPTKWKPKGKSNGVNATLEGTTTTSAWDITSQSPTMTRLQAIGRFHVLHTLIAKRIPYVVWGLEALACHSVPTFTRDPLEVLVPKEYLIEAAKAITADHYTFYRRIAPFDHVDDYTFANNISILLRRNLKEC